MYGQFEDAGLERSYRIHQLRSYTSLMVYVLCIFTMSLILLAICHLFRPDWVLLLAVTSAVFTLTLNIILSIRRDKPGKGVFVAIALWLFVSVLFMTANGSQSALIPVVIATFTFYTAFPFELLWTIVICVLLALAQVAIFILKPIFPFSIDQLLATIIVHFWSNFVGIYLYSMKTRLSRAVYLNSRNVLISQNEALQQQRILETLLSTVCPRQLLQKGLLYLCEKSNSFAPLDIESFQRSNVLFASFDGLEELLSQISLQDSTRLLNEFDQKINNLCQQHNLVRIPSDNIVFLSLPIEDEVAPEVRVSQAALDLSVMIRSFCEATSAELKVKIGVGAGPVACSFLGSNKWHFEATGPAVDQAKELSLMATMGVILVANEVKTENELHFNYERLEVNQRSRWRLISSKTPGVSALQSAFCFVNQRRLSLTTLPQAVNRVLNASTSSNVSQPENYLNVNGRRKKKMTDSVIASEKLDVDNTEFKKLLNPITMEFKSSHLEKAYHTEVDRWFIPGLAISILFLVVYGAYQVLVMPRLIVTLALTVLALIIIFTMLLLLYISYFANFSGFITQTKAGHAMTIFIILVLLNVCGLVNVFSCSPSSITCQVVYYPVISFILWMLTVPIFIKFGSKYLILSILLSIGIFNLHMFRTQSHLYKSFGFTTGWNIEWDILNALFTLAMLIYLQSRRNEKLIRLDFISHLNFAENVSRFDRVNELLNAQINNQLPAHIANNFFSRTDPYNHLCHSVGVITVQFGDSSEWHGSLGLQRLQELLLEVDHLVTLHKGLEKVRSSGNLYVAAVGVLPEVYNNIHDVPFTIGDLLASVTNFAFALKEIADDENIKFSVGIDCGPALSVVIGGHKPYYEVIGAPKIRSQRLMETAVNSNQKIIVSEEIYLAIRPRNFQFDDNNPIQVAPGLIGYGFVNTTSQTIHKRLNRIPKLSASPHIEQGSSAESSDEEEEKGSCDKLIEESTQSTTLPTLPAQSVKDNVSQYPLSFFAQNYKNNTNTRTNEMHSSMSSELYSVDLSVESDSDLEWITPEMLVYDKVKRNEIAGHPPIPQPYKGDCAKQYSDFSEVENSRRPSVSLKKKKRLRHKHQRPLMSRNGPKLPSWLSSRSSFNSELSLSRAEFPTALDKLDSTSKRVDQMIQELANMNVQKRKSPHGFPLSAFGLTSSMKSINSRREMSSACHTDYDNADSEAALSDNELLQPHRYNSLGEINVAAQSHNLFEQARLSRLAQSLTRKNKRGDIENDADIDSNCSSMASSMVFDKVKWKSVHSIGYDNEYEIASMNDYMSSRNSSMQSIGQGQKRGAVGDNIDLKAMDDDDSDEDNALGNNAATEVQKLSEDIRRNFGDYKLATFSDLED